MITPTTPYPESSVQENPGLGQPAQNHQASSPAERGRQIEAFRVWCEHDGDWQSTAESTGHSRRTLFRWANQFGWRERLAQWQSDALADARAQWMEQQHQATRQTLQAVSQIRHLALHQLGDISVDTAPQAFAALEQLDSMMLSMTMLYERWSSAPGPAEAENQSIDCAHPDDPMREESSSPEPNDDSGAR